LTSFGWGYSNHRILHNWIFEIIKKTSRQAGTLF
jgi:hypothetical protein